MAKVTLKKWGNSTSVRLPLAIMESAKLHADDVVDVSVDNQGRIIIIPVEPEMTLQALVSGITEENLHPEITFGRPVGKEQVE
ncbi:AbrB/MazE/SpoVT family DNA-binding domain-containing protein [Xenorhabdus ishibashii]|uniref:MazE protein n=1 Tax=Xenorhabdus ishibashii TaxID=1034471 RepID=A0A2D0KHA0_9GAMM|nr:AbrB/MazE/SpoVT family DNA-binding domain-containing protein [Xenorhabdus ishibashii]PHM62804.1 MazE protein [Xenorhabdus ishibashii]